MRSCQSNAGVLMDDRIERLLHKAEEAIDGNQLEQADSYRVLAGHVAYLRRREAKDLNRALESTTQ